MSKRVIAWLLVWALVFTMNGTTITAADLANEPSTDAVETETKKTVPETQTEKGPETQKKIERQTTSQQTTDSVQIKGEVGTTVYASKLKDFYQGDETRYFKNTLSDLTVVLEDGNEVPFDMDSWSYDGIDVALYSEDGETQYTQSGYIPVGNYVLKVSYDAISLKEIPIEVKEFEDLIEDTITGYGSVEYTSDIASMPHYTKLETGDNNNYKIIVQDVDSNQSETASIKVYNMNDDSWISTKTESENPYYYELQSNSNYCIISLDETETTYTLDVSENEIAVMMDGEAGQTTFSNNYLYYNTQHYGNCWLILQNLSVVQTFEDGTRQEYGYNDWNSIGVTIRLLQSNGDEYPDNSSVSNGSYELVIAHEEEELKRIPIEVKEYSELAEQTLELDSSVSYTDEISSTQHYTEFTSSEAGFYKFVFTNSENSDVWFSNEIRSEYWIPYSNDGNNMYCYMDADMTGYVSSSMNQGGTYSITVSRIEPKDIELTGEPNQSIFTEGELYYSDENNFYDVLNGIDATISFDENATMNIQASELSRAVLERRLLNAAGETLENGTSLSSGEYTLEFIYNSSVLGTVSFSVKSMGEMAENHVLTVDDSVTFEGEESQKVQYTKFVPDETSFYKFRFEWNQQNDSNNNISKWLYEEGKDWCLESTNEDSLFVYMEADKTYYIKTQNYGGESGEFTISVLKKRMTDITVQKNADEFSYDESEASTEYNLRRLLNQEIKLQMNFEDGSYDDIEYQSSYYYDLLDDHIETEDGFYCNGDESIEEGIYYYVIRNNLDDSVIAKIKVSINGMSATDYQKIELGEKQTISDTEQMNYYSVDIPEAGLYEFELSSSMSLYIKDELGNYISAGNDEYNRYQAFVLQAKTYYFWMRADNNPTTFTLKKMSAKSIETSEKFKHTYLDNEGINFSKIYENNLQNGYSVSVSTVNGRMYNWITLPEIKRAGAQLTIEDGAEKDYSTEKVLPVGSYKIKLTFDGTFAVIGNVEVTDASNPNLPELILGADGSGMSNAALKITEPGYYLFEIYARARTNLYSVEDEKVLTTFDSWNEISQTVNLKAGTYLLLSSDTYQQLQVSKFEPTNLKLYTDYYGTCYEGYNSEANELIHKANYRISFDNAGNSYNVSANQSEIWHDDWAINNCKITDEFGDSCPFSTSIKAGKYRMNMTVGSEPLFCQFEVLSKSIIEKELNITNGPVTLLGGEGKPLFYQTTEAGYHRIHTEGDMTITSINNADTGENVGYFWNNNREKDQIIYLPKGSFYFSYNFMGEEASVSTISAKSVNVKNMTMDVVKPECHIAGETSLMVLLDDVRAGSTITMELDDESLTYNNSDLNNNNLDNLMNISVKDLDGKEYYVRNADIGMKKGVYTVTFSNQFLTQQIAVTVGSTTTPSEIQGTLSENLDNVLKLNDTYQVNIEKGGLYSFRLEDEVYLNMYSSTMEYVNRWYLPDSSNNYYYLQPGTYYVQANGYGDKTESVCTYKNVGIEQSLKLNESVTVNIPRGTCGFCEITVPNTARYTLDYESTNNNQLNIYIHDGTKEVETDYQGNNQIAELTSGKTYICALIGGNSSKNVKANITLKEVEKEVIDINDPSITVIDPDQIIDMETYEDSEYEMAPELMNGKVFLQRNTDYKTSRSTVNWNDGTITFIYQGIGDYTGTMEKTFSIKKYNLKDTMFYDIANQVYTGEAIRPIVKPVDIFNTEESEYSVSYSNNINKGTATVTITGLDKYDGTVTKTFDIVGVPAEKITLSQNELELKSGETATLSATFIPDNADNTEIKWMSSNPEIATIAEDGTVVAVSPGVASIAVKSAMDNSVRASCRVTVAPYPLSDTTMEAIPEQSYDGTEKRPSVVVKDGDTTLVAEEDYTAEYTNNIQVGTANVTIEGIGRYEGTIEKTFEIVATDINSDTVNITPIEDITYDGTKKTPSLVIKNDTKRLIKDVDYEVTYTDNIEVGEATAHIKGINGYTGTRTFTFNIVPVTIADATISIQSGDGQYYDGTEKTITVDVRLNNDVLLEEDTDYKIEYQNNINSGIATATIKGTGGYTGTRKLTFQIEPISIASAKVTVDSIADEIYDGIAKTPVITVKYNGSELKLNENYKVDYYGNLQLGEANVLITGQGNFAGTRTETFTIKGTPIDGGTMAFNKQTGMLVDVTGDMTTFEVPEMVNGEKVLGIGSHCFNNCPELQKIIVPESVVTLADSAFTESTALTKVYFEGDAPTLTDTMYTHSDSVTFYVIEGHYGWTVPEWNGWNTEYYIPENAEYGYYAVDGGSLKYSYADGMIVGYTGFPITAAIPSAIEDTTIVGIAENAFENCTTLENLYIPVTMTDIADTAFIGVTGLRMYGEASLTWATYASEHGYTYTTCAIDRFDPVSMSTIGGAADDMDIYMTSPAKIPLALEWTNEADKEVEIPVTGDTIRDYNNACAMHHITLNLENVTSGTYTLRVINSDYGVDKTATYTIDRDAPSVVQNLQVVPGELINTVTWNKSVEADVIRYEVYRKNVTAEDESYVLAETIYDRDTTSYTDNTVAADVEYSYYIIAVDQFAQKSEGTQPVSGTPRIDMAVPTIDSVSPNNGSTIHGQQSFTVKASDNKAVKSISMEYKLAEDNEEWMTVQTVDTSSQANITFDTTDIAQGNVWVRFKAIDIYENVGYSTTIYKYLVDNQGPEQVKNLTSIDPQTSIITLKWDDVADEDFSYFQVEEQDEDNKWNVIGTIYDKNGMNISGLLPETTKTYRVVAYDTLGNRGKESESLTTTTIKDTTNPVVSNITPEAQRCKGMLTMTFTLSDDVGITKLVIQTSPDKQTWTEDGSKDVNQKLSVSNNKVSVTYDLDTDKYPEGSLYVRGIATDYSGNESNQSETAALVEYVIDRTAPEAPQNLSAERFGNYITLAWTQGSEPDLAGYRVLRKETESGSYKVIADDLKTISYIDKTAEYGKSYTYKLQVKDSVDNISADSKEVIVAVPMDEECPKVYSLSPSEGYVLGKDTELKVLVGDNDLVATIKAQYSTDGSTWIDMEDIAVAKASGVYTLPIKPGDLNAEQLQIKVWCVDQKGNASEEVARTYTIDTVAPSIASLAAIPEQGNARLSWSSLQESDLAGFYIYRKASSESSYTCVGQKSAALTDTYTFLDESVKEGNVYSYYVAAADTRGNTANSEYVSVLIPTGTKADTVAPRAYISGNTMGETGAAIAFSGKDSWDDKGITEYIWDFGDDTEKVTNQNAPSHTYQAAGTYKVTLVVKDAAGNQGTSSIDVTIKEKNLIGSVEVTVQDENGQPVAGAGVYFDLGTSKMTVTNTDNNGIAMMSATKGQYPIGAYKDGYLPTKTEVQIIENTTQKITMKMEQKDIVVGEITVHRMTLEEIIAAGINVEDEANQNVFKFETQLTYNGEKIDLEGLCNDNGDIISDPEEKDIDDRHLIIDFIPWPGPIGGGGGNGGGGGGSIGTTKTPEPMVAVIDIPGETSWLKDFFDVQLSVFNQAGQEFALDNCNATLNVPSGLTLMDTNKTTSNPTVSMGTIVGGQKATAEWILRGDEPGKYDLSADFSAMLRDFGADVKANFKTSEPFEVRDGQNLYLDIVTESAILEYTDGAIRVGFRNEDANPVYYPKIKLDKVQFMKSYKTKGVGVVKTDKDVLLPGEEIWFDYIIDRDDWDVLMKNEDSEFYLEKQILKKISGVEMKSTFTTVQPLTISPDKIEVYEYDIDTNKVGKQISLLDIKKTAALKAEVPDLMIKTYREDENGVAVPTSMNVKVKDGYGETHETGVEKEFTTNAEGTHVLKGYEITDWWSGVGENKDDNKTNYKAYDILFYSSRAMTKIPVVARGNTATTGQLKISVKTRNEKGDVKRIAGATVEVDDLEGETGKEGMITFNGVHTGNQTLKIKAEGYQTLEEIVKVSETTEKSYYLTEDDGLGHSSIKKLSCDLQSNSLGNITIVPEGRVTGMVTFTLDKDIVDGETFESYVYKVVDKDGNIKDEKEFKSDKFLYDMKDLSADDKLYFALKVKIGENGYTTPYRDSYFYVTKCPNFLNNLTYNLSQFTGDTKWTLNGESLLKIILGDTTKKDVNLANGTPNSSSDEKEDVLLKLLGLLSVEKNGEKTYPFTASYETSGKVTFKANFVDYSKKNDNKDATNTSFFAIRQQSDSKRVSLSGGVSIEIEFTYNTVTDQWDGAFYGVLDAATKVKIADIEYKLVYASIGAEATGKMKFQFVKSSLGDAYLDSIAELMVLKEGSLGANLKLAAGGMIGDKDLLSIGAYVKMGMNMKVAPYTKVSATTEFGWESHILFVESENAIANDEYELYSDRGVSSKLRVVARQMAADAKEGNTTYQPDTGTNEWVGSDSQLASSIYYDSRPQIVKLEDGSTLMVYANYRANNDNNPITVYYTRNVNDTWTEPKEVVADGTVGLYPSLKATDTGVKLTWMKMSKPMSDLSNCTYSEIVEKIYGNMNVCQATYDASNDSWVGNATIDNGNTIVASPKSESNGTSEMTTWITNKANTENATVENPDVIKYVVTENGETTDEGEVKAPGFDLSNLNLSVVNGKYILAAQLIDEEGNGKVVVGTYDNGVWSELKPIGASDDNIYAPQYVKGTLYYLNDGQIMKYEDGKSRQVLCSDLLQGVENMTVSTFGTKGIVLAWAEKAYGGSVYTSIAEDGINFSEPFAITTQDGICGAPRVTEKDGSFMFVFDQATTDDKINYNLKTVTLKKGINLAITEQESDGVLYGGSEIHTTFKLDNIGSSAMDKVNVAVATDVAGLNKVASMTLENSLTGTIIWNVPEEYAGETYYLVATPAEGTDVDISNNAVTVGNEMRDIAIQSCNYMGTDDNGTNIVVNVGNTGIVSSGSMKLQIADLETDEILSEQDLEALKGGDSRDISITLDKTIKSTQLYITLLCSKQETDETNNTEILSINQAVQVTHEHDWSETVITKQATCTEKGEKVKTCSICQKEEVEELPALGHDFGAYKVTKQATAVSTGVRTRYCSRCDATQTQIIPKLTPTIKLTATSIVLKYKQSTTLVKVSGLALGDKVKSWTSSNTKIAKVSSSGKITALTKAGKATITVTLASGKKATIAVKVQKGTVKTSKISGVASKLTLAKGKKATLKPILTPITSQEKVKYTTSNKKVATVSSKGVITGKKKGTAKITVISGKKKKVIKVTVK